MDFLLECLKPYGITKDNIKENIPRLLVDSSSNGRVDHFFLDGNYIFSIEATTTYRKFMRNKDLGEEVDL